MVRCAQILRQYSSNPAQDLQAFVQWLFFNLYMGNNDSYAKNLSVYWRPGQVLPGQMGAAQVQGLAEQLGMGHHYLHAVARTLAAKVPEAIDHAVNEIAPQLSPGGWIFAGQLAVDVKSMTRRLVARPGG